MSTIPHSGIDNKTNTNHVEKGELGKTNEIIFNYVPGTDEEKRLVRKIDRRLLPMLWFMYILNYLDRTNIGNAKTGGMQADLKLTSNDYSLALSIFFVGYLLNEVPSNMVLARSTPSKFLPTLMAVWGAMSVGAKGINSLAGLVVFRFFLGCVEAGFFPGVMLLLSCWYKPRELSKRLAIFYAASLMSGAFGGLLAGGIIDGLEGKGNTRGWKWLFIIEGLMTFCVSLLAYFILPNFPATTPWLSVEEKRLAIGRLASVEDEGEQLSHRQAFIAAVTDLKTWGFLLCYNVLNSVGTISYFFPTLMTSLGYKGRTAQFMTVPIYVVALVITLSVGWSADRTQKKAWHLFGACVGGAIAFIICATVKNSAVRYAFICFGGAGVWTAVPLFLSWMVTMFDGRERRAISIALINGFGNLSSVYGSFFWPATGAPLYHKGFAITTSLMGVAAILVLLLKWKYNDKGHIAQVEEERQFNERNERGGA